MNQFCSPFSFLTVFGAISTQVPAPWRRLGMAQDSQRRRAVFIPPAASDLQSFTIFAISRADDDQDDPASQVCGGGIDNIDHHPQRQRRHRLNIHGFDDDRENFDDFVDE